MKDFNGKILYKETEYPIIWNLNVMERIQEEYGSVAKWTELIYNDDEPLIKPVVFALFCMINEGIEIENEDNGTNREKISLRMAGRIASEIGLQATATTIGDLVLESSTEPEERKNA